VVEINR